MQAMVRVALMVGVVALLGIRVTSGASEMGDRIESSARNSYIFSTYLTWLALIFPFGVLESTTGNERYYFFLPKRGEEESHGNYSDCHLGHPARRHPAYLAPQFELGTLSQRRNRIDHSDLDRPVADGADLRWR